MIHKISTPIPQARYYGKSMAPEYPWLVNQPICLFILTLFNNQGRCYWCGARQACVCASIAHSAGLDTVATVHLWDLDFFGIQIHWISSVWLNVIYNLNSLTFPANLRSLSHLLRHSVRRVWVHLQFLWGALGTCKSQLQDMYIQPENDVMDSAASAVITLAN